MSRTEKAKAAPNKGNTYYDLPHADRVRLLEQNVPAELRKKRIWLLWQGVFNSERNKWDKIPYYTNGQKRHGQNGSAEDRAALVTFEQALKALAAPSGEYDGLGIALLPDSGVVAVDLDKVDRNPAARKLAEQLNGHAYVETSPSGNGWRYLYAGSGASDIRAQAAGIELFGEKKFVTVTGWAARGKRLTPWKTANAHVLAAIEANSEKRGGKGGAGGTIPEGARNTHLTSIAGTMRRRGMSEAAIEAALLADNAERCNPPLGEEEVRVIAQSVSKYPPGEVPAQLERSPAPGRVRPPLEMWRNPPDRPAELWGVYIRKGIVTVVAGPGGSYKSALLLAMVTQRSKSGGGEYLGHPVAPGKTLIVLAEDRIEDCVRRMHSIAHRFMVPVQAVRDAVEFIELTGTDWTDLITLKYGQAVVTDTGKHIEQEARASGCDLIIIETANRVTADETNPVFRKLVAELERIAKATGAAVVITSHVSKAAGRAGTDDHHAARGGGALTDNARSVLILSVPEEGTEEAARGLRYLTHAKSTHSEASRQVLLEIVKLPNCGLPVLSDVVPAKEARREIMRLEIWDRARLLAERTMAALKCDEVTANQMRQHLKNSGIDKNGLAGALETAVTKGTLLEIEVPRQGQQRTAYRLHGKGRGKKP
jgi:hypothetical protein